ncbi:MAG: hypothetical protein IPJ22_02410 [Bacteroidetes bacterium]|jgi:hypothetical protein|nr:hypothetical protein [Bacteroidota bacterium]
MDLVFQHNGNLEKGIHIMTISDFERKFGFNDHRKKLIKGLKKGIIELKDCGCKRIYIDGSFVTKKEIPNDFDSCWDDDGVDILKLKSLYPTIIDFDNQRKNQKIKYYGEFFPARIKASPYDIYIDFFQFDKNGDPKGIIQINLN